MKALVVVFLLALSSPVVAQHIDHWVFPKGAGGVELRPLHGGIVGIEPRVMTTVLSLPLTYSRTDASLHVYLPGVDGTPVDHIIYPLQTYYATFPMEGISPEYHVDVLRTPLGSVLAAASMSDILWTDVGTKIDTVQPMRVVLLENGTVREIASMRNGRNPRLTTTASGEIWLTWEQVIQKETGLWSQRDRDYASEIRIARIAEDLTLQDTMGIGPGVSPRWSTSSSGEQYLLWRVVDVDTEEHGNRILMRRILPALGPDVLLDRTLHGGTRDQTEFDPGDADALQVLPGLNDDFHILCRLDSLLYLHLRSDGGIVRSAYLPGSLPQLFPADGGQTPALFWRSPNGSLFRSSAAGERMFTDVTTLPGTENGPWWSHHWHVQEWTDGDIKLTHGTMARRDSLMVLHHAASGSPRESVLFVLPEEHRGISDWLLMNDGTLWLSHYHFNPADTSRAGLYRITDLQLGQQPLTALPSCPRLLALYPHPLRSQATLTIDVPAAGMLQLRVYDLHGRLVAQLAAMSVHGGEQNLPLLLPTLPPGMYMLHGSVETTSFHRLVVLR